VSLEYEDLTGRIIAAAIEVHKRLGPGFLESIYENPLLIELQRRGLHADHQMIIDVNYNGHKVGEHRLDMMVEDTIVVKYKAVKDLEDVHFANVKFYLKASGKSHGLLLNFAKPTLEIKRVIIK
jgi:GxxExxY protein